MTEEDPPRAEAPPWRVEDAERCLDALPDDLEWTPELHEAKGPDHTADYVDGYNAGLAIARHLASHLRAALESIHELRDGPPDERGRRLWEVLEPLRGRVKSSFQRRVYGALIRAGIWTPEDLRNRDPKSLLSVRGIGATALAELERAGLLST